MKKTKLSFCIIICLIAFGISSCKKMLEVNNPINQYPGSTVFETTSSAVAALTSIYISMGYDSFAAGRASLSVNTGFSSDELAISDQIGDGYFDYFGNVGRSYWTDIYGGAQDRNFIYRINAIIEGVSVSKTIPESAKRVLIGEAKFLRGFCYFYLVNLFGDVPLVLTTDFKINSNLARSNKTMVYDQIIADLTDAKNNLNDTYLEADLETNSAEKIRPNKSAALALLARVYLFTGKYQDALNTSTVLIQDSRFSINIPLNEVFLKNSKEAIWQLQTMKGDDEFTIVPDTRAFIPFEGETPSASLSSFLQNAFEPNDLRIPNWTEIVSTFSGNTFIIPYKYKSGIDGKYFEVEYTMVFRLAEQYLIRAESRLRTGDINGSLSDLNQIRSRAGLPNSATKNPDLLFNEIVHERQIELFTEWGHRWLDLKRTNTVNEIMPPVVLSRGRPGLQWQSHYVLYAIPVKDLKINQNLAQNPGYSSTKDD